MPQLTSLTLGGRSFDDDEDGERTYDLVPLAHHPQLQVLSVPTGCIQNVGVLGHIPQLRELACDEIDDLDAWRAMLPRLSALEVLRLKHYFPECDELNGLGGSERGSSALRELHIDVPDAAFVATAEWVLPPLSTLQRKLQSLTVLCGALAIDGIGALASLTSLGLYANSVSDLTPLPCAPGVEAAPPERGPTR